MNASYVIGEGPFIVKGHCTGRVMISKVVSDDLAKDRIAYPISFIMSAVLHTI